MGLHVILALSSIVLAVVNFVRPGNAKLASSYALAVATLVSGIALIFVNNASVLRTCMTGIVFFAVVSILNELARRRLAATETRN